MILNHSKIVIPLLCISVFLCSRDISFTVVHALLQLVSMLFIDLLYMVPTLVEIPTLTSVCEIVRWTITTTQYIVFVYNCTVLDCAVNWAQNLLATMKQWSNTKMTKTGVLHYNNIWSVIVFHTATSGSVILMMMFMWMFHNWVNYYNNMIHINLTILGNGLERNVMRPTLG